MWQADTFREALSEKTHRQAKIPTLGAAAKCEFLASRRLEGVDSPLVTLNAQDAQRRLEELRRHYER
jgi:hypothetical protein